MVDFRHPANDLMRDSFQEDPARRLNLTGPSIEL